MWRLILLVYSVFILNQFGLVDNTSIRIPLFRQRTPRENALNSPNMEHHGIFLDWLHKPPHKHNNTNDSISLLRYLDTEFYGKVLIGTKGKVFNMVFDTAWSLSWVMSSDCSWKTIGCLTHGKYDHTSSSTYKRNGTAYVASEGSYNLTGYFSNDTFSIAHSRVDGQMFVEMTYVPYTYIFSKADGVMGLATRVGEYKPFFYNLLEQSRIKRALFSIYLNRNRESSRCGNIILGLIDHKHIHQVPGPDPKKPIYENITYLPVDSSVNYWKFDLDRIIMEDKGKNKSLAFCLSGCKAFPDTSTNIIIGPKADIEAIHVLIKAQTTFFGLYKVNCDTINKLPKIDFILAGKNFTLSGENYVQRMTIGPVTFCISAFRTNTLPFETKSWILGGAFLSEFYSIYDMEKSQIGFVRAA